MKIGPKELGDLGVEVDKMEDFIGYFMLYIIFQVGVFGFLRALSKITDNKFTAKNYLVSIIPIFGFIIMCFLLFKYLLKDEKI